MPGEMQWDLVPVDSPRWAALLKSTRHDFYHLPQYLRLCADQEGGVSFGFLAEDGKNRYFAPLIVCGLPRSPEFGDGCCDAIAPYGYACPLMIAADPGASAGFLDRAIAAHIAQLRRQGITSAFFRLHPLFPLPADVLRRHGCLVRHGETVLVDLTLSEEELWRQTRSGHRTEIERSRRNGYEAAIDSQWRDLDEFCAAYAETMRRVGAHPSYFFPRDYFARLKAEFSGVFHLCTVRVGGEFACGGLFSECCGIVQYHLSGTADAYARRYPTKLMLDFVRRWAKDRGNKVLHLGGGVGAADDSLFQFKAGFSKLRGEFFTWRVVVDEAAYAERVRLWEARTGSTADPLDGFFPAYRKNPACDTTCGSGGDGDESPSSVTGRAAEVAGTPYQKAA